MSTVKTVKRYANRKLYDTERSCYVTLEDIASMIRTGDEVRVIDNKSGDDLTSVTFAQIIFETEKKKSFMPLSLLRNLIQQGESAIEDARERVAGSVQARAEELRTTASKLRSGLEDKMGGLSTDTLATPRKVMELLSSSQKAFEELQRGVEDRIKNVGGSVTRYANLGRDLEDIRRRLADLEQRLEGMPQ